MANVKAKSFLERLQQEEDELYKAELDRFDPNRIGLRIFCPNCRAESWLKLGQKKYYGGSPVISCPTACGCYGPLKTFSPKASAKMTTVHFDIHYVCPKDEAETLSNGTIFKCPVCAIDNPRQIMRDLKENIVRNLKDNNDADALAGYIGKIVSTFDGVMRACNKIAISNREAILAHPVMRPKNEKLPEIPRVGSFQNVTAARAKLMPEFDMARCVSDWNRFVLIFQKRHLIAHTLGVADEDYLKKSGGTETPLGKKVTLTTDDVIFFANETEDIVRKHYGYFLG